MYLGKDLNELVGSAIKYVEEEHFKHRQQPVEEPSGNVWLLKVDMEGFCGNVAGFQRNNTSNLAETCRSCKYFDGVVVIKAKRYSGLELSGKSEGGKIFHTLNLLRP